MIVSDYANNVSSYIKDNVSSLEEYSSQFRYFIINCHELDNQQDYLVSLVTRRALSLSAPASSQTLTNRDALNMALDEELAHDERVSFVLQEELLIYEL